MRFEIYAPTYTVLLIPFGRTSHPVIFSKKSPAAEKGWKWKWENTVGGGRDASSHIRDRRGDGNAKCGQPGGQRCTYSNCKEQEENVAYRIGRRKEEHD